MPKTHDAAHRAELGDSLRDVAIERSSALRCTKPPSREGRDSLTETSNDSHLYTMGIHKLSIQTTRLSHSLLLAMVLATGCGPDDALDPEAKANAEQAYVECMQTRGFEIEHINLSSSDYDVRVVPGDFSRDDLARATVECEELVEPILLGEQTQVEGAEAYYQEFPHQELSVEMSDGTALATTLILPEGDGPFPTLLIRTPYDRKSDFVSVGEFRDAGIA